jgi:arylsulfatase A-like enzyme
MIQRVGTQLLRTPRWLVRRIAEQGAGATGAGRLMVLLGLTGFALSQPLLAVLGEEPTWFTFRDADTAEVVAFSVLVALVPPLALWVVGLVAGRLWRPLGWWFHLAVVAALVAAAVIPLLRQAGSSSPAVQVTVAALVAVSFTVAYAAFGAVALWVRYTAILPPLAIASFLFLSPTSDIVRPSSGAGTATPAGAADADAPSVFLLVLDELPTQSLLDDDGNIDEVRFPNLAAFAQESTWYTNYTSSSHSTRIAVPSILSGKAPAEGPPTAANHPDTLFSLLAPSHRMKVSEGPTALCDTTLCPPIDPDGPPGTTSVLGELVADGADVWRDRITPGETAEADLDDFAQQLEETTTEERPGPSERRRAPVRAPVAHAEFLPAIEPADEPTLWFQHLVLPHQPWILYPDGTEYHTKGLGVDPWNSFDEWISALNEQRHLFQMQYTDALVGQLIDRLKDTDTFEDALVVVVADHGVSFIPGTNRRSPVEQNLDRLAYVPLLIKEPGQTDGHVDRSNVFDGDLLPTIADRVGAEVPWDVVGHPIGSPEQRRRGTTKEFYDFGAGREKELQGVYEFGDDGRAPSARNRWIGSAVDGQEANLSSLLSMVGVDDLVGRSLDDIATGVQPDYDATLRSADELRSPGLADAQPGLVTGRVADADAREQDIILVEVNGTIVTGSPLWSDDQEGDPHFDALLPPGALEPEGNEVRLALWRGDDVLLVDPG